MESLPYDVLHKILQIGIKTKRLDHTDLCSFAIVNSHFDQLTRDPAFWTILLYRDFPYSFHPSGSPKTAYRRKHKEKRRHELVFQYALDGHKYPDLFFQNLPLWQRPPRYGVKFIEFIMSRSATAHGSSSGSNISHDFTEIHYRPYWYKKINVTDTPQKIVVKDTPSSDEEGDYPAIQPTLRQENKEHYKFKQFKRFDKSPKPKVVPNSKSYIPMNRPPRRSMPRKT